MFCFVCVKVCVVLCVLFCLRVGFVFVLVLGVCLCLCCIPVLVFMQDVCCCVWLSVVVLWCVVYVCVSCWLGVMC